MRNLISLLLVLVCNQGLLAQVNLKKLDKNSIPRSIKYTGNFIGAASYSDNDGQHLVITTETGETPTKGSQNESRDAALYAYHYQVTGNTYQLTWRVYDFITDCVADIKASYLPNTFAVTDLDKDGKTEVWLMYKTVCRGDVSPSDMKIIMHQGDKKYAVRGRSKVKQTSTEYEGGSFDFDQAFKAGPAVFRQYASALWKKNLMETWE